MRVFGLVGYPLGHSFSRQYFSDKFLRENLSDCRYELFEMPVLERFPLLLAETPELCGLNVTIPHKRAIIPYLDGLSPVAEAIGAVNCIRVRDGNCLGHNTDAEGFASALQAFMGGALRDKSLRALILGKGGAALAAAYVLGGLGIPLVHVARADFPLREKQLSGAPLLIVNATPLGMFPAVETCPEIDFAALGEGHWVFDMVYNPEETLLLRKAAAQGAQVCNGLSMLWAQAAAGWRFWNDETDGATTGGSDF